MSIKVKSRRFIAKYFSPLVEFVYYIKIRNTNFKREPVIIISPGKVGSSSVYETLKNNIKNPVYHIHQISEEGIERGIKANLNSARRSRPLHLIISKLLRKKLLKHQNHIHIITLVREPISRIISSFFQNTELYKKELENKKLQINTIKAQEMVYNKFESDICGELEEWFDNEIKGTFGIDVFSKEFDFNNMYVITHHKNHHHLLLRMEDLNRVFPKAIQEFLNLDYPLHLKKANISKKKYYAQAYSEVKDSIKLPQQTIEEILNSKYFQHFYKGTESEMIKKWSKT